MTTNCNYALSLSLHQLLNTNPLKLAFAESCTAGSLSVTFTAVNNASRYLDCAFITYSNESKTRLLGVEPSIIEAFGAVSKECASAMATGALKHSSADLALSITGIAGPSGGDIHKPVGTIYLAIAKRNQQTQYKHLLLNGGRKNIRRQAVQAALEFLIDTVSK
tara:strand:+ start:64 stop:555 length:492 start_codon:yes stop_codon:yes gene_type:complete